MNWKGKKGSDRGQVWNYTVFQKGLRKATNYHTMADPRAEV
jgi:hypothetical protein